MAENRQGLQSSGDGSNETMTMNSGDTKTVISSDSFGNRREKVVKKVIDRDGEIKKVVVIRDVFIDDGNRGI